jgi:predicted SAM-dependent methyltransferase
MLKLHIGCGKRKIPGFINLDILGRPEVDIVDNARTLEKIKNSSCDIIYASHVLEHFGRYEFSEALRTWHKKLKPGGLLRVSVPDFEKVIHYYNSGGKLSDLLGFLYGGQRDEFDYHKIIFDRISLTSEFLDVGFSSVRSWDWKKTEHREVDDYSQAYLPHMDKKNGLLMSLNLEAIK